MSIRVRRSVVIVKVGLRGLGILLSVLASAAVEARAWFYVRASVGHLAVALGGGYFPAAAQY